MNGRKHLLVQKWRENMKSQVEVDNEFEAFLRQEAKEINEILAGLQDTEWPYQIIIEPDEDEFHAYCPALKGLHVGGITQDEALQNAKDAAVAMVLSMAKHGEDIAPELFNWVVSFSSSATYEQLFSE